MTTYNYPYSSALAKDIAEARAEGVEIQEWQKSGVDIDEIISHLEGPIIEIGGPTARGYYYLENVQLSSKVIITNNSTNAFSFMPNKDELNKHIEQVTDGQHLPFGDDSLAMVLAMHIPMIDESKYDLSGMNEDEEGEFLIKEVREAEKVIADIANTGELEDEKVAVPLRLMVGREVYKKLKKGGVYITDASADEIKVYEVLGFTKLAEININSATSQLQNRPAYYDVVLQK